MKLNRRQVLKAGLAASTIYSPWMLGIAQSKPIKTGFIGFLSAPNILPLLEANRDFLEYLNERGGIGGRKVEFVQEDHAGDPTKGVEVLNRLLTREPETLFVAGDSGVLSFVLSAELTKLKMGYTSPSHWSILADPKNHPSLFMLGATNIEMFSALLQEAKRQKPGGKIALVYINAPHGKDPIAFAKEQAAKDGMPVVLEETFASPVISEPAPIVAKLLQANPDFVLIHGALLGGEALLIKAARDQGLKSVFMGTNWSAELPLIQYTAGAADGYIVTYNGRFHYESVPMIEEIKALRASKGRPVTPAVLSNIYLATWAGNLVNAEAMRRAEAAGKLTREGLRESWENMGNYTAGGLLRDTKFVNHRWPYTRLYKLNAKDQKFDPMGDWVSFT